MKRISLGIVFVALISLAPGCRSEQPPAPRPAAAEAKPQDALTLRANKDNVAVVTLKENVTTGFSWNAKFDSQLCKVELRHRGAADKDLCGAPGKVEVVITLLSDAPAAVTLEYRRPWEKNTPPAKVVRYTVTPEK